MQGRGGSAFYSVPIPAPMKPCFPGHVRLCEDGSSVGYLFHLTPLPDRGRPSSATFFFATERTGPNGTDQRTVRSDQRKDHKDKTLRFRMVNTEAPPEDTASQRKHFK
ncbi:hypothetical protein CHT98_17260 (plasmid) [Azospirillum brasilense]|uniref:Uncharacterized protein n=1 Tax=Azospirillum brasilense TaxID=192 RepID=A0A235HBP2_AZOBR|nr:hypothetical protein CHT98_17260 [Azospirillum brasilense]